MKKNQPMGGLGRVSRAVALAAAAALLLCPARAGEGMWTFDNPPLQVLKEKFGFQPSQEWLDHLRLSSVRIGDGGSGSFVSPGGLVLTNHHVALGQLQKVSTPQKNYVRDGFLAKSQEEEIKCPDLEMNVLVSMEDVTAKVQGSVRTGMAPQAALDARKAATALIEKESQEKTGLRSDVASMYQGGEYWLYRYKKYTDVRLVFAPEQQIAFYGGDPDNFTYPRYDLDMAIFRAYEGGAPVKSDHYLKWNPKGAADGDLVFVSGHPGRTSRLMTLSQLEYQRDVAYPARLKTLKRALDASQKYASRGTEQARQVSGTIFGIENSLKSSTGEYDGLKDAKLMALKAREEREFRAKVDADPALKKRYGAAWDAIAKAQANARMRAKVNALRKMPSQRLGGTAIQIVRLATEMKKPDGERLEGFHDSQLESLKFRLFSPAPVYPEMEEALGVESLRMAVEELGGADEFVKAVLNGRTPEAAMKEMVSGTKLADPAFRKQLVQGGPGAVAACKDPFIEAARRADPILREMQKWGEANVESIERPAGEKIAAARFAVYGKSVSPDANFTLRISYGTVKGYPMNGTVAPPMTTCYGLYDRAYSFGLKPPFQLPERYLARKDNLDLSTPLNFVCTCDIIGGNSGSPVVNRAGEIVGLVFDGNIESLVGRFVFDETANRTVSVHAAGMIQALLKLYDAEPLAKEILGR